MVQDMLMGLAGLLTGTVAEGSIQHLRGIRVKSRKKGHGFRNKYSSCTLLNFYIRFCLFTKSILVVIVGGID